MNIRFPNTFDAIPASVQDVSGAIRRSDARTKLVWGTGAAVLTGLLAWWGYHLMFPAQTEKRVPAAPVKVGIARRSDVTVNERTVGTIVANATVQVTAQVGGQMMSAGFKEGDIVSAGQVIFRLDPRPFQAALEQAQATRAKDQAALVSAHNDQIRYDALFKQNAISQQQRDQADATAKGLVATVQADEAAIDVAKLNLGYSIIRAPIDGKTGPILVQPGNLVAANGTTPLVTITQIHPVKVSFFLPQTDLPQIQARMTQNNMTVTVQVHGQGGKTLTAPVDFVSNAVSAQTGTIELRATFPNLDNALVPGQLADASVTLNRIDNATVVPHDAVNLGPDSSYVWVVDGQSKANMRKVTVLNDDGSMSAVQGPVKPGDRVITDGALRVVQGTKVVIKKSLPGNRQSATQAPVGAQ